MYDLKSFSGNGQQLRSIRRLELVEVTSARHKLATESSRETDKTTIPNDGAASIIPCTRRRLDMLNKHSSYFCRYINTNHRGPDAAPRRLTRSLSDSGKDIRPAAYAMGSSPSFRAIASLVSAASSTSQSARM